MPWISYGRKWSPNRFELNNFIKIIVKNSINLIKSISKINNNDRRLYYNCFTDLIILFLTIKFISTSTLFSKYFIVDVSH